LLCQDRNILLSLCVIFQQQITFSFCPYDIGIRVYCLHLVIGMLYVIVVNAVKD